MKKIIITYGLIAGAVVSAMLIISQPLIKEGVLTYENSMIFGYAAMVIALSMVFFGVKTYRDQRVNGIISFGGGFRIGILITLIASVVYAISWEIYYNIAASDFMEQYSQYHLDKLAKEGASEDRINSAQKDMESWNTLYKNPVIRFGMTLIEIFPVGLIITLLSAALLRKKEILPVA